MSFSFAAALETGTYWSCNDCTWVKYFCTLCTFSIQQCDDSERPSSSITSSRHISGGRKEGCRVKRLQLSLLILLACRSASTRANPTHTPANMEQMRKLWMYADVCGCMRERPRTRSHTHRTALFHTRTHTSKMCRKWGEEALDAHIKT